MFSHSQQVRQLHSYRATLIPADTQPDEVEFQAAKGLLPTLRLKAADADEAKASAHKVTGRAVFDVERMPEAVQA